MALSAAMITFWLRRFMTGYQQHTYIGHHTDGLSLFAKPLKRGRFVWPQVESGSVSLARAQLSTLVEGIDWRRRERTHTPELSRYKPNELEKSFTF
jgi:transposase